MKNENTLSLETLTNKRKDGNTTRQVDYAIQLLFSGKTCLVTDHCSTYGLPDSTVHRQSKELCWRILRRLKTEHNLTVGKDIDFDNHKLTISLITNK